MSLNYNLEKVTVTPTIPFLENGDMNLTTHALIWIGMVTCLDAIKESNVDEWVVRTGVLRELIKSTKFTREDITANIGMSTNCDNLTRAKWMARMSNIQKRLLNGVVDNAERANKKAVISLTFASQKIKFYVSIDGTTYGASRTDQSGVRPSLVDGRTVCGEPVEFIGEWNKSQMPYAPFADAVVKGVATLKTNAESRKRLESVCKKTFADFTEHLLKRARERLPLPLTDLSNR